MLIKKDNSLPSPTQQLGFSLIELLTAMAIAAILATIALPSYRDYVIRGKIPDATSSLVAKRIQMEQWFQDRLTYVGATACNNDTASSQYFTFSCAAGQPTRTTFTLQAVGTGSMAGFTFTIDQNGTRATAAVPSGWIANANCWVTKKGGGC